MRREILDRMASGLGLTSQLEPLAVPLVLDRVEVEGHTGVLAERVLGGPAGDLGAITADEALRRGRLCGFIQLSLAAVRPPPLVLPAPGTERDGPPPSLLHLDLHPFNVLIDPAGTPVVIDWANAASGPAVLDQARTAAILTFDPAARRLSGDPRWHALVRGWSEACRWHTLPTPARRWALQYLLTDLTTRCSTAELEPARAALNTLSG